MSDNDSPVDAASARSSDPALEEARRLLSSVETDLHEIEREIDELGLGTNAACEVCGGPIEAERLVASPAEKRCATHAGA